MFSFSSAMGNFKSSSMIFLRILCRANDLPDPQVPRDSNNCKIMSRRESRGEQTFSIKRKQARKQSPCANTNQKNAPLHFSRAGKGDACNCFLASVKAGEKFGFWRSPAFDLPPHYDPNAGKKSSARANQFSGESPRQACRHKYTLDASTRQQFPPSPWAAFLLSLASSKTKAQKPAGWF